MLFGERDPVELPGTPTGSPGNWWTVFAGVPDCFDHAVAGFAFYRSPRRTLDPKLRELGQTRAGFARGSRFVFSQHCKASRSVGLSDEQVAAIPAWSVASCFSARAGLYRLPGAGGRPGPRRGLRSAPGEDLSDQEILELTYITCTYDMHATMCRALRLEFDDVEDPVTEVPGPESGAMDVMAAVDPEE
jgi:alkylhydroperoxidase family enzyme